MFQWTLNTNPTSAANDRLVGGCGMTMQAISLSTTNNIVTLKLCTIIIMFAVCVRQIASEHNITVGKIALKHLKCHCHIMAKGCTSGSSSNRNRNNKHHSRAAESLCAHNPCFPSAHRAADDEKPTVSGCARRKKAVECKHMLTHTNSNRRLCDAFTFSFYITGLLQNSLFTQRFLHFSISSLRLAFFATLLSSHSTSSHLSSHYLRCIYLDVCVWMCSQFAPLMDVGAYR